jgi:hypothetical protein
MASVAMVTAIVLHKLGEEARKHFGCWAAKKFEWPIAFFKFPYCSGGQALAWLYQRREGSTATFICIIIAVLFLMLFGWVTPIPYGDTWISVLHGVWKLVCALFEWSWVTVSITLFILVDVIVLYAWLDPFKDAGERGENVRTFVSTVGWWLTCVLPIWALCRWLAKHAVDARESILVGVLRFVLLGFGFLLLAGFIALMWLGFAKATWWTAGVTLALVAVIVVVGYTPLGKRLGWFHDLLAHTHRVPAYVPWSWTAGAGAAEGFVAFWRVPELCDEPPPAPDATPTPADPDALPKLTTRQRVTLSLISLAAFWLLVLLVLCLPILPAPPESASGTTGGSGSSSSSSKGSGTASSGSSTTNNTAPTKPSTPPKFNPPPITPPKVDPPRKPRGSELAKELATALKAAEGRGAWGIEFQVKGGYTEDDVKEAMALFNDGEKAVKAELPVGYEASLSKRLKGYVRLAPPGDPLGPIEDISNK